MESLKNVELFATGTYRGRTWPLAYLDRIAANVKKLGPSGLKLLRPPAVIGHEDDPSLLERTDLPAAAWLNCDSVHVRRYRDPLTGREEGLLIGDLLDVPPTIAALIRAKRYRKVSAEIYDDFQDDHGRSHGPALRRIALLGGELPQVKRIADLPMPVVSHSECRVMRPVDSFRSAARPDRYFVTFAEESAMNRDDTIAAIEEALPGLTDEVLADILETATRAEPAEDEEEEPVEEIPEEEPAVEMADRSRSGEVAKVARFAEKNAATIRHSSLGPTPSHFVAGFRAANARRRAAGKPALSAAEYTGQK